MLKLNLITKKLFLPVSLLFPFSLMNNRKKNSDNNNYHDKEFMDNLIKIIESQRM